MIILSVPRSEFLFFHQTKFFTSYPSLSCKLSPDFIQVDRGLPGLSTKQSLATTVDLHCLSNFEWYGGGGGEQCFIGHFIHSCNQQVPSSLLPPVSGAIMSMSFYYLTVLFSCYRIKPSVSRGQPHLLHKKSS